MGLRGATKKTGPGAARPLSLMAAAVSAVASTTRMRISGDMLQHPIKITISTVSYMDNEVLSLQPESQKALLDLSHKMRLVVDNPGRDIMELSMLDTSMAQTSGAGIQAKIRENVKHVKSVLERLLPFCTAQMPAAQMKIVATIVVTLCKMIRDHDQEEIERIG